MAEKKKETSLSWDAFKMLGNPENAPDEPTTDEATKIDFTVQVRVHFEKKGRGGKTVLIIRGIEGDEKYLEGLAKKLKVNLGVGGSAKDGEIVIQGSNREKTISILQKEGFKNVKPAGG